MTSPDLTTNGGCHHGKTPHLFGLPGSLPRLKRGILSTVGCPGPRCALDPKSWMIMGNGVVTRMLISDTLSSKAQVYHSSHRTSVYQNPKINLKYRFGGPRPISRGKNVHQTCNIDAGIFRFWKVVTFRPQWGCCTAFKSWKTWPDFQWLDIILSGPIIMVLGMLIVWYQGEVEQIFCDQFRKSSELESLNYVQIIPNTAYNFQIDCQCRLQNPF